MSLSMSDLGLGESLRLGPQFAPVPQGTRLRVIQRGPHGASLAPRPPYTPEGGFQWWSEQVAPDPWQPQQSVVGFMGLGAEGTKPEATYAVKRDVERESKRLAADSVNPPPHMIQPLIAQAQGVLGLLNGHRAWSSGWHLGFWGRSSQEDRADLQVALQNLTRRQSDPMTVTKQPMQDAKRTGDFAWGETTARAGTLAEKTARVIENAGGAASSILDSPKATAAVVVLLGLVGLGVHAYASGKGSGPTIRVG